MHNRNGKKNSSKHCLAHNKLIFLMVPRVFKKCVIFFNCCFQLIFRVFSNMVHRASTMGGNISLEKNRRVQIHLLLIFKENSFFSDIFFRFFVWRTPWLDIFQVIFLCVIAKTCAASTPTCGTPKFTYTLLKKHPKFKMYFSCFVLECKSSTSTE